MRPSRLRNVFPVGPAHTPLLPPAVIQRFADERTVGMEEEDYVKTFFEFRKAFFLKGRCRTNPHGDKKKHPPGSRPFLVRATSPEAGRPTGLHCAGKRANAWVVDLSKSMGLVASHTSSRCLRGGRPNARLRGIPICPRYPR